MSVERAYKRARLESGVPAARTSLRRVGLCAVLLVLVCCLFPCVARANVSNTQGTNPTITLKITSQDDSNHEYKGYLLVSGDVVKLSDGMTIESPSFSQGTFDNAVTSAHVSPTIFEQAGASAQDCASAQDFVDWIATALSTDTANNKTVELAIALQDAGAEHQVVFTTNEPAKVTNSGYWLITSDDAQPMLLLAYEGMDAAAEKSSTPVLDAKVLNQSLGWGAQADYSVGTNITYRVSATLPTNVSSFDAYPYAFVSTFSEGITPTTHGVEAFLESSDGTTVPLNPTVTLDGRTLTFSWEDLAADAASAGKTIASSDVVIVQYTGERLNEDAKLGVNTGNVNTVALMYPRSPTAFEAGSEAQGQDATTGRVYSMGQTVPITVTVYCYALAIQKVDASSGAALAGATFTIMDKETSLYFTAEHGWSKDADKAAYVTGEDGALAFVGLGSGTYVLTEVAAPDGYSKLDHTLTASIVSTASTTSQTHADPELTVTVKGDDAEVTSVDAEAGIATVRVSDAKASNSASPSSSGGNASSTGGRSSTGSLLSTMTSLARTGDPLFWGMSALLALSGAAAVWSGICLHKKQE